jgi:hypothetical protein
MRKILLHSIKVTQPTFKPIHSETQFFNIKFLAGRNASAVLLKQILSPMTIKQGNPKKDHPE